ncbi:MAG: hypothetical protein GF315_13430 [candidate division Zixibacteria bacterium]|nr:hypothetical protein [candidate division Zixibacteria bacterium]
MKYYPFLILIFILLLPLQKGDTAEISSIEIDRMDVFDSELQKDNWFVYRWGNTLHILTKEWVIRDELLYDVGEELDTLKILETERNLRALEFIGDADTELNYNDDSSKVDVELTTSDQWTTIIGPTSEGSGGEYTFGFALSEKNLFGWGKDIMGEYYTGNDLKGHYFDYIDYNFFRTRLRAALSWENDGYVRKTEFSIRRPLYSLTDKYAVSIYGFDSNGNIRYFNSGYELFRYQSQSQNYLATLTRSYGVIFKKNLSIKLQWSDKEYFYASQFSTFRSLVPPDETETRADLELYLGKSGYKTVRYLDNFGNVEDLTLGWGLIMSIGRAFEILGGNITRNYGKIKLSTAFNPARDIYIAASSSASARFNGDWSNAFYANKLYLYWKNSQRTVSALRLLAGFYDRPDSYIVNYIGGKFGLRGYDNYALAGQNYLVANFEQRYYSPIKILTVALGFAGFVDVGKSWYENAGYDSEDWKADVGIGLRFGLTKSSGNKVVRIDIARSLSEDKYNLSFGTLMFFSFGR